MLEDQILEVKIVVLLHYAEFVLCNGLEILILREDLFGPLQNLLGLLFKGFGLYNMCVIWHHHPGSMNEAI